MPVNIKNLDNSKVEGKVTVESAVFELGLDHAFKSVVKTVNVPGFRKGKVPRNVFEKRFGVEALYEKAINFVLMTEYPKAVEEAGIDPVAQPNFDVKFEEIERGSDFEFTFEVAVRPEVTISNYKGLEISKIDEEVTKEDIDNRLKQYQTSNAEMVVKESGSVEPGDIAIIDFVGKIDNVEFDGGAGENHSLKIGSNTFIPGFEDQVVGMNVGETKVVEVTFPSDYHAEDLKGKLAHFDVTVNEIKVEKLPELNDELVATLNIEGVETVEQLTQKVTEELTHSKKANARSKSVDEVVAAAAANAKIDIPQEMISAETEEMIRDIKEKLKAQGIDFEMYLNYINKSRKEFRDEIKEQATSKVTQQLTLEEIVKLENIEVTEEDLNKEYARLADIYKLDVEEIKAKIGTNNYFMEEVKIQKAIDFLIANAVQK